MEKRILLVGGTSGGHVYPLIAVAQALQKEAEQRKISLRLLLMGSSEYVERAAKEGRLPYKKILAGGLRRYATFRILFDLIKIPIGVIQSFWHVFVFMPDVVFSKGGYDSVAPVIVARIFFIPIYLHESDSIPGLANRFLARFAQKVFVGFKTAEQHFPTKAVYVGNPVRPELTAGDRSAAMQSFHFSPDQKTVLVLGGSQGAKQINDALLDALVELVENYQVIHQCGDSQYDSVRAVVDSYVKEGKGGYGALIDQRYRLYPFLDGTTMQLAYAACDIIISRAGAGSLFEIASLGKPAIIIPLQQASRGEQLTNALEFEKTGASIVEGSNITTHILLNQIKSLLEPNVVANVQEKMKLFATPQAGKTIASVLLAHF